jgi:uncharacterized protein (DUF1778 family)
MPKLRDSFQPIPQLVRLDASERREIEQAAKLAGCGVSEFMRQAAMLAMARRTLRPAARNRTIGATIFLRLTREAKSRYEAKAKAIGISLNEFFRSAALRLARSDQDEDKKDEHAA